MAKNYEFEELRFYAIFPFIFFSIIYIFISTFLMHSEENFSFSGFFLILLIFGIYNLIRYRYLNTLKFNSNLLFLIYGCIDLFYISYFFNIPALDKGGKAVILFILIMASIYKNIKIALVLTCFWFPIKTISDFVFINLLANPKISSFNKVIDAKIAESLYFQFVLLLLVFLINLAYKQLVNKETDSSQLFSKLEYQYKTLITVNDQIEAKNIKLNNTNNDLQAANQKLTHSVAEFFTLQQISNAIGSILDMDELIKYVNDVTLGVMGVKSSTIILFNQKNLKLEIHTTNITDESEYKLLHDNIGSNSLLRILEGETIVCDNNVHSNKFNFTLGRNVKSLLCVPIISKLNKFGLILLEQNFESAFDINSVRLLTVIAQQVAMAMENADLYYKMHKLAVTDNLTGAYNRVYFHERLNDEFIKSQNEHTELSIAILDVDHFKRFNDTYGHLFGDKVLKSMSELINQSIRSNDVMARFGGEEFIILFPCTNLTEAYDLVEEIRKKIASTQVTDDIISVSITVSLGVSSFPKNSSSITELIKNADDALYQAKDSGRNCVRISKK